MFLHVTDSVTSLLLPTMSVINYSSKDQIFINLSVFVIRSIVDIVTAIGIEALTYQVGMKRKQIIKTKGSQNGQTTNHLFSSKQNTLNKDKFRENQDTMDINKILMKKSPGNS